jgi:hypothetical protein
VAAIVVRKSTMLFFPFGRALDGRVDWTEDRELARREARRDLYVDLARLLRPSRLGRTGLRGEH